MTVTDQVDSRAWTTLDDINALVEPELRAAVDRLPAAMRLVAGYQFGWWDADGVPSQGVGGKGLRPALTVLSAACVGVPPQVSVGAAVAVELVHNFTLLHDDIMDGDELRRHRPSGWAAFGPPAALLAGDVLLVLATDVLAERSGPNAVTAVRTLNAALFALVDGQSADVAFERAPDVSLDACLAMAAGKTAALMECACVLGAHVAGVRTDRTDHLGRFGHHLGLAFQLTDDLIGIWGDPTATGKSVGADLRVRKKSLPVVAALRSPHPAARRLRDFYVADTPLTDADTATMATLVDELGGRSWAEKAASHHLTEALAHLDAANPEADAAADLTALAGLVDRRTR
ncbi:geranylgeranyl diphosphate synthase type I [Saccharothrix carnea]|uniref:Geranylgeranyl diphosphate synthase type I n=1 Tax=Saccharothrix carnea TaxID=1280637 RepID=A0A2P8IFM4_SACCR|nr:polyprenyl synthetase family protein [Saccharothrix carnea]PSL57257.1 geranylgeranyl diphosphate synthase type I [Saccharothrix carnea]